jgi:hypothetical protein
MGGGGVRVHYSAAGGSFTANPVNDARWQLVGRLVSSSTLRPGARVVGSTSTIEGEEATKGWSLPPPWPRPTPSSQWQAWPVCFKQGVVPLSSWVPRVGAVATRFPQPNVGHVKSSRRLAFAELDKVVRDPRGYQRSVNDPTDCAPPCTVRPCLEARRLRRRRAPPPLDLTLSSECGGTYATSKQLGSHIKCEIAVSINALVCAEVWGG